MSGANHFQRDLLSSEHAEHLRQFGEWLQAAHFKVKGGGIELCIDNDLAKKVDPLLLKLGVMALVGIPIIYLFMKIALLMYKSSISNHLVFRFGESLAFPLLRSTTLQTLHTSIQYVATKTNLLLFLESLSKLDP